MRRSIVAIVMVLLTACSGSSELAPAAPPSEPGGIWAITFSREMGTWTEGRHGYRVGVACPDGTTIEPAAVSLRVSPDAPTLDMPVYLRFDGPGVHFLAPSDLERISPDQDTTAVINLTGLTESQVPGAATCTATVVFDGGEPVPMTPGEPYVP